MTYFALIVKRMKHSRSEAVKGRNITDGFQPYSAFLTGTHRVVRDGRDGRGEQVSSGVYFCTLIYGVEKTTRKMSVVR